MKQRDFNLTNVLPTSPNNVNSNLKDKSQDVPRSKADCAHELSSPKSPVERKVFVSSSVL